MENSANITPPAIEELTRRLIIAATNIDECYYANSRKLGCKQSELNLMFALAYRETCSQKQIIDEWQMPKTTLNTVTKQWEAAGYITLQPIPGKRREMQICLTPAGRTYIDHCLTPFYQAEQLAMQQTLQHFAPDFINAIESYSANLTAAFDSIGTGNTNNAREAADNQ